MMSTSISSSSCLLLVYFDNFSDHWLRGQENMPTHLARRQDFEAARNTQQIVIQYSIFQPKTDGYARSCEVFNKVKQSCMLTMHEIPMQQFRPITQLIPRKNAS